MTAQQRMQMQLDKQEEQIQDLFKSVREIKNMNISNKAMFKGLILGFGIMVASDIGIVEILMKVL
jgi:phosphoribosylaminoimidazole (AIR) synthetase